MFGCDFNCELVAFVVCKHFSFYVDVSFSVFNRVLVGKNDTLVVDFTDSYKEIIAAFKKFKGAVEDFSAVDANDLQVLQKELLFFNVFTKMDIDNYKNAILQGSNPALTTVVLDKVSKLLFRVSIDEIRRFRTALTKFNSTFKYLDNLFRMTSVELRFCFVYKQLR